MADADEAPFDQDARYDWTDYWPWDELHWQPRWARSAILDENGMHEVKAKHA